MFDFICVKITVKNYYNRNHNRYIYIYITIKILQERFVHKWLIFGANITGFHHHISTLTDLPDFRIKLSWKWKVLRMWSSFPYIQLPFICLCIVAKSISPTSIYFIVKHKRSSFTTIFFLNTLNIQFKLIFHSLTTGILWCSILLKFVTRTNQFSK